MQLNEHISKSILSQFGPACSEGILVQNLDQAVTAARDLGLPVAVKAQVPASGRGKAGGIRRAVDLAAVQDCMTQILGLTIDGLQPQTVRVERWIPPDSEAYLAIAFSEKHGGPVILFSTRGGVDVESEDTLSVVPLRDDGSVDVAELRRAAEHGQYSAAIVRDLIAFAEGMARAFEAVDARTIEANPVGIYADHLEALDVRIIVDDNALFRQPEIRRQVQASIPRRTEDLEREASGLEYVELGGSIGLISGGAGMTLAAMDLVESYGAASACFLDCSANPTKAGYGRALELMQRSLNVDAILISIFGGLTLVDKVAKNVCELLAEGRSVKPVVFRLMGADVAAATAILAAQGYDNHEDLEGAVADVISRARAVRAALDIDVRMVTS
jgi:succinyl-CoA synthetase beta subunit